MTTEQTHLQAISEIIANFLKTNGGFGNGYETYLKGTVSANATRYMEWSTPTCQELTMREIKQLGYKLNEKLSEYLQANKLPDLQITSTHIEWGTYEIFISYQPKQHKISLI